MATKARVFSDRLLAISHKVEESQSIWGIQREALEILPVLAGLPLEVLHSQL